MAHTIKWFEIGVKNLEAATEFYSEVLNKPMQISTEHGFKLAVFPHEEDSQDVAGCLYEDVKATVHEGNVLIYFDVNKRIHDAVNAAKSLGGKVVEEPHQIGPWGFRAVILDREGNKVALHAMEEK